VEARHRKLLEGNPFLHQIISLDTLAWRKDLTSRKTLAAIRRSIEFLREAGYDTAVDFQGLYKSALIAKLSGAKRRVGFAARRLREPAAGIFYTAHISARGCRHVIDLNLALVEHLGAPRAPRSSWQFPLPASREDDEYVTRELVSCGTRDFIIINPGGGWKSKCWAPENYAELIRKLAGEFRGDFLLTGSPDEEPVIHRIIQDSGRARYFPSTITQFIALARRARLVVGGDTGPLHLAAAVRTPIVAIYGPTDPARNGPVSAQDITLWNRGPVDYTRRAAKAGYIPGISVASVAEAVRQRLARAHE